MTVWPCTPPTQSSDDTAVVGLITNNDETAYREEVKALRQENNLSLRKITFHSISAKLKR
jgi:hypothetical protein